MRNSIRQLLRTRVRTFLFFFLISLCALLICLGGNLINQCKKNMEHFKEVFVTIGTVEQTAISVSREARYNNATKTYTYFNRKEFGPVFSLSELDMGGITYITEPERRPFYSAYLPDCKMIDDNTGYANELIFEVQPAQDCIPDGPVRVNIINTLFSVYQFNNDYIYFCDHYNDQPEKLYADRTYITCVMDALPHEYTPYNLGNFIYEYIPNGAPISYQSTPEGERYPTVLTGEGIEEINDDFIAQGRMAYWEAYAKEMELFYHSVPVTPTNDLNLIMSFYNNDVVVRDGQLLSEEDFEKGNTVCLISFPFAKRNNIKVGDTIPLSLRAANYSSAAVEEFGMNSLTADGRVFEPFFEADYTVAGIYYEMPSGGTDRGYTMADNEIVIPAKSIRADNSEHIGRYGRSVSPYNTAFRIPNGTVDEFMEKWTAKGIDDVTIHFYDKGYSKLEDGIRQMERMAYFLLFAGIIMTLLVLVFFSHMMIGGQKKRTAIERSLGASKKECLISMLTGIMIVAALGSLLGCLVGTLMTGTVAKTIQNQEIFDSTYSAGVTYSEIEEEQVINGELVVTCLSFLGLMAITMLVSGGNAWKNLKEEPLTLLSGRD